MMKDWNTPVYAFFSPIPDIEYVDQCRCHVFKCLARGCPHKIHRFLDKGDKTSTGNMSKHVQSCWGENVMKTICSAKNLAVACNEITEYTDKGSITASFEQKGKGKVTYRHRQHTCAETRAEIVCWVAENLCPFEIVNDHGFQSLMKTGQPEYYIPHPTTVSRDTQLVFANVRKCIAKMLRVSLLVICMQWLFDFTYQEFKGELSFVMDAWTSPNHKSFVAVTVHLTHEGKLLVMVLDIVEVAKV
jgi:hypothetical protein